MPSPKPVVLCILDGWGLAEGREGNAPCLAHTPNFDRLMAECPNATLTTHGPDVGLPRGQMGNSEVGHTNIGAGRVVAMDLGQIDLAIEDGSYGCAAALTAFIEELRESGGTAHLLGLISDGGVHGHIDHVIATAHILHDAGVPAVIHAMTDGRDVAPSSGEAFLDDLVSRLPPGVKIATVCGRYYAMDRDNRWDRVARAYSAIAAGAADFQSPDARTAVSLARERGETDEFIQPTVIEGYDGLSAGDGLFCLNFRADRAREILSALTRPDFSGFDRGTPPDFAALLGMVEYSDELKGRFATVFPKREITNTLAAWVAAQGRTQFHLAETEKYPHVTFFFNGGKETPEPGEDRKMPPSPDVATYDLAPEMSAAQVGEYLCEAIRRPYDFIVVNFANPDMVGHTGDIEAASRACEAVDRALGPALDALKEMGGAMIVTADHGNCETMIDPETGGPHTAHTLNPVPVILVGGPQGARLSGGRLSDLAPSVLALMGLPIPEEMTGRVLFQ